MLGKATDVFTGRVVIVGEKDVVCQDQEGGARIGGLGRLVVQDDGRWASLGLAAQVDGALALA
jgi:hypothetical protein